MNHHYNSSQATHGGEPMPPKVETKDLETEPNSEQEYYYSQWEKILTPWSIGGLLIVLIANLLLIHAKWQQQEAIKTVNQTTGETKPNPVNLTQMITLQSLSRLRTFKVSPSSIAEKTNSPLSVPEPPNPNKLRTALLPLLYLRSIPEEGEPIIVKPQSQETAQSLNRINPPETKTSTIKINPLPIPALPTNPNAGRILIEQNLQEAEQSTPLSFNQKTRAKVQAIETNQDPNKVSSNMQQLQNERLNQPPATSP